MGDVFHVPMVDVASAQEGFEIRQCCRVLCLAEAPSVGFVLKGTRFCYMNHVRNRGLDPFTLPEIQISLAGY